MPSGHGNLFSVAISAPGKVILHGEHSVVYGKTAIATSLGLRTSIELEEQGSPDPFLKIHLPCIGIAETFKISDIIEKLSRHIENKSWDSPEELNHDEHLNNVHNFLTAPKYSNLKSNQICALKGVLYLFSAIVNSENLVNSIIIRLKSELTVGAGMGSSASFAVVVSAALIKFVLMTHKQDFTNEEKDAVCRWAFNCERIMHGTPSGIDNATCTYGSLVSFRKGTAPVALSIHPELRILLVDTRVSRETRAMTAKVAKLMERNGSAVDHVLQAIEDVTHSAIEVMENISGNSETLDRDTQYNSLAELWNMNHFLLASLGVSHANIEEIRATAAERTLACKLTGAGGGGYAMVLLTPLTDQPTLDDLVTELNVRGYSVIETRLGGDGVRLDSIPIM